MTCLRGFDGQVDGGVYGNGPCSDAGESESDENACSLLLTIGNRRRRNRGAMKRTRRKVATLPAGDALVARSLHVSLAALRD